jgi:hypothetical protein
VSELTKLDIAEQHIIAGFQMIGAGVNPYSVHLVSMAADEIIETIADQRKVLLEHGATLRVKKEHRGEWFKAKRAANNFFKHADRDSDAIYEGPDFDTLQRLNDANLAFAILGLEALGRTTPGYFKTLIYMVFCLYPTWCKWGKILEESPEFKDEHEAVVSTMTRQIYEGGIRKILAQTGVNSY